MNPDTSIIKIYWTLNLWTFDPLNLNLWYINPWYLYLGSLIIKNFEQQTSLPVQLAVEIFCRVMTYKSWYRLWRSRCLDGSLDFLQTLNLVRFYCLDGSRDFIRWITVITVTECFCLVRRFCLKFCWQSQNSSAWSEGSAWNFVENLRVLLLSQKILPEILLTISELFCLVRRFWF